MEPLWDTPAVLVDLDVMERNMSEMAERGRLAGVKLRPHVKTHKSVWIAKEQLRHGAAGITVAKLGEAEIMAEAGISDILIAFPIIGKPKLPARMCSAITFSCRYVQLQAHSAPLM